MCKIDGIEVTHEGRPAWDAAVASFQRNLRGQLQLIRTLAADGVHNQSGNSDTDLAAAGS
jgi:hypothetical protein